MIRLSLFTTLLAFASISVADAIKVGGDVYSDVYVRSDAENYYILLPDEGRIEKVSRKRTDIVGPKIEEDESVRQALLDRYEENRAELEMEREQTESAPSRDLDSEMIKEKQRLESAALFDAQYAYWKELSEEERDRVIENLLTYDAAERQSYAMARSDVTEDIVDLETEKAQHEARLRELEQLRQQLIAEAVENNAADRFMLEYEAAIRGDQLAHRVAVASLDSTIGDRERDAVAVDATRGSSASRTGTFLARIEELNRAIEEDYEPELETSTVATWEGSESKKTEPFAITEPLWRLSINREDLGQSGALAVTVYDAETGEPFTRISDVDFLQMRVRVLDGPGRYYLEIEQDDSDLPYEITAVTLSD